MGLTGKQIYDQLSPTDVKKMDPAREGGDQLHQIMPDRAVDISTEAEKMPHFWEGKAGEAAQSMIARFAIRYQDHGKKLGTAQQHVHNQIEAASRVKESVDDPGSAPHAGDLTGTGAGASPGGVADTAGQQHEHDEKNRKNIEAYEKYVKASQENGKGLPPFEDKSANKKDGHDGGGGGDSHTGGGPGGTGGDSGGHSGPGGSGPGGTGDPGGTGGPGGSGPGGTGGPGGGHHGGGHGGGHGPGSAPGAHGPETNAPGPGISGHLTPSESGAVAGAGSGGAGYGAPGGGYGGGHADGGHYGGSAGGAGAMPLGGFGGAGGAAGAGGDTAGSRGGFGGSGTGSGSGVGSGGSSGRAGGGGAGSPGSGPRSGAGAPGEAGPRSGAGASGASGAAGGAGGRGGPGGMPMGGRGAGKGQDDQEHETPSYLVHEEHGNQIVGDLPPTAPPVIGA